MTLHVQASNEAALAFYKKHGFDVVEKLEGYYKELEDPDCYVLNKRIDLEQAKASEEKKEEDSATNGQSAKDKEADDGKSSTQLPASAAGSTEQADGDRP